MNTPDDLASGNTPSDSAADGSLAVADSADGAAARLGVFRASVIEERRLEASRARMLAEEYHRLKDDLHDRLSKAPHDSAQVNANASADAGGTANVAPSNGDAGGDANVAADNASRGDETRGDVTLGDGCVAHADRAVNSPGNSTGTGTGTGSDKNPCAGADANKNTGRRGFVDYLGEVSSTGLEVEAMVTEYALACQLTHGVVTRLLDAGLAVADGVWVGDTRVPLDDLREAWELGEVQARHVTVIVSELRRVTDPAQALTLRDELLSEAPGVTPGQLEATARRLRTKLDQESLAQAHRRAFQNRHITMTPTDDGMAIVTLLTDAVTAVAIINRSRTIAKRIQHDQNTQQTQAGAGMSGVFALPQGASGQDAAEANPVLRDSRTLSQLQHDAATELLIGGVTVDDELCHTTGSTVSNHVQATVTVTVPAMTLLDHDETPAELDGYGPIAANTARVLIGNSMAAGDRQAWFRILTDPATGIPLRYDKQTYSPPPSLRRYVQQRDGTCRFPGCHRPSRHCDIDHTYDWQFGGHTNANNLACLCRRHHTMKHHTNWKVEHITTPTPTRTSMGTGIGTGTGTRPSSGDNNSSAPAGGVAGDGVLRWTSPTGATYVTKPTPHIPATLTKDISTDDRDRHKDREDDEKPPF